MDRVGLKNIQTTASGSYHVQLMINGSDCGMLYLSQDEYELMSSLLLIGCTDQECTFYEEGQDE